MWLVMAVMMVVGSSGRGRIGGGGQVMSSSQPQPRGLVRGVAGSVRRGRVQQAAVSLVTAPR